MTKTALAVLLAVIILAGSSASQTIAAQSQCGGASWYALTSRTASGVRMNPDALTAAHRDLPFGTQVAVTNQSNGRTVMVTINDRGPFAKGRIIDLSRAAAVELGFKQRGHTKVCLARV